MRKLEWKTLGVFQMTATNMAVADPQYPLGGWGTGELRDCLTGEWEAVIGVSDEGGLGPRVAILAVRAQGQAEDALRALKSTGGCPDGFSEMPFVIGVDSGQAGFFDKAFYGKDTGIDPASIQTDFTGWGNLSLFYRACCDKTLDRPGGILPFGAVSSSGYGDGAYTGCYHTDRGRVDMALIQFL